MYQMSYNTSNVNMNATSIAAFIVNIQKENTDLRNKIKTLEDENTELHIQIAEYHIESDTSSDTESVASNDYESDRDTESDSDFFVSYNSDLTDAFDKLASYEEDPHKRDAYRKAADAIYKLPFEVKSGSELASGPKKVPGIGKGIAKKIDEFLETGKIGKLEKIEYPNQELADIFDSLCYHETDEFKKAAYDDAAYAISKLTFKVTSGEELSEGPKKVPGIGKGIAKKIDEFLDTGKIGKLEKIEYPNQELADIFDSLCYHETDEFKKAAYDDAAYAISKLTFKVTSGEQLSKGPKKIPGIGKGIAKKIDEFLETGKIKRLEDLKRMEAVFEKTASICPLKKLEKSWSVVDETHNDALVDHFMDMATEESDEFKSAAYEKAAEAIDALNFEVTSGEELSKGPKKVPGIGKGIAKKIDEFLETGKIKRLEELKKTTSTNEEIAWHLEALASLEAESHGSKDPFKIRAYRRAAEIIRELDFEVTSGAEIAKGPKKIEGIGAGIGKKIDEFLQTGKMKRIEELSK